jgi:chromosome segregation ATPase
MVDSSPGISDSQRIQELVERLREIQRGLKLDLAELHTKLEALDSEPNILRLGDIQKDAESRARNLESEVKDLREELKALRELLGSNTEKKSSADL